MTGCWAVVRVRRVGGAPWVLGGALLLGACAGSGREAGEPAVPPPTPLEAKIRGEFVETSVEERAAQGAAPEANTSAETAAPPGRAEPLPASEPSDGEAAGGGGTAKDTVAEEGRPDRSTPARPATEGVLPTGAEEPAAPVEPANRAESAGTREAAGAGKPAGAPGPAPPQSEPATGSVTP